MTSTSSWTCTVCSNENDLNLTNNDALRTKCDLCNAPKPKTIPAQPKSPEEMTGREATGECARLEIFANERLEAYSKRTNAHMVQIREWGKVVTQHQTKVAEAKAAAEAKCATETGEMQKLRARIAH